MSDMTRSYVWHDSSEQSSADAWRSTGWRRLIGCLELQVISRKRAPLFCKRATNHRALLREMAYADKESYDCMPPCSCEILHIYVPACINTPLYVCHYSLLYMTRLVSVCDMVHEDKTGCVPFNRLWHTATHYNTLQHTAAHCNTLQHIATHCNTLQHGSWG